MIFLRILLLFLVSGLCRQVAAQTMDAKAIVLDLFRLRNEHKADSAERYFADTVKVYMKTLRNVPKSAITKSDKQFWKQHPRNKFEITSPLGMSTVGGITTIILYGKEYTDGTSFVKEKIEIRLNRQNKIFYYRGFLVK